MQRMDVKEKRKKKKWSWVIVRPGQLEAHLSSLAPRFARIQLGGDREAKCCTGVYFFFFFEAKGLAVFFFFCALPRRSGEFLSRHVTKQ